MNKPKLSPRRVVAQIVDADQQERRIFAIGTAASAIAELVARRRYELNLLRAPGDTRLRPGQSGYIGSELNNLRDVCTSVDDWLSALHTASALAAATLKEAERVPLNNGNVCWELTWLKS